MYLYPHLILDWFDLKKLAFNSAFNRRALTQGQYNPSPNPKPDTNTKDTMNSLKKIM